MADETKHPNPIDLHVGSQVRMRRKFLGLSQEALADPLGLTFQQVQKYEKGANRMSASRLYEISKVLKVPVTYFFEGIGNDDGNAPGVTAAEPEVNLFFSTAEGTELASAFSRIPSPALRHKILDLVRALAKY